MEKDMDIIFTKTKIKKLESFVVLSEKKRINRLLRRRLNFEIKKKNEMISKDVFFYLFWSFFYHELILASFRILFCHWKILFILIICRRTKFNSWSLWLILLLRLFLLSLSLSSSTIKTVPFKLFLWFSSLTILFFNVWYFFTKTTWGICYEVPIYVFYWRISTGSLFVILYRYNKIG